MKKQNVKRKRNKASQSGKEGRIERSMGEGEEFGNQNDMWLYSKKEGRKLRDDDDDDDDNDDDDDLLV